VVEPAQIGYVRELGLDRVFAAALFGRFLNFVPTGTNAKRRAIRDLC
jgi:hypothetical protein